jgi:hypothetical protein
MPMFNVKKAVNDLKAARVDKPNQPTPYDRLIAENKTLQAENKSLHGENSRLHATVRDLEKANERSGSDAAEDKPRAVPVLRNCAECGQSAPDSGAFFGSAFNDPDRSKCASCSRTLFHESGIRHYTAGCRHCLSENRSGDVFDGVMLKWMGDE